MDNLTRQLQSSDRTVLLARPQDTGSSFPATGIHTAHIDPVKIQVQGVIVPEKVVAKKGVAKKGETVLVDSIPCYQRFVRDLPLPQ